MRRRSHCDRAAVQDVRVYHRGAHVAVTDQLLHGSVVVAGLEQVGRERVTESNRLRCVNVRTAREV